MKQLGVWEPPRGRGWAHPPPCVVRGAPASEDALHPMLSPRDVALHASSCQRAPLAGAPRNLAPHSPRLQKIIHRNDGAEESCTERDGWCLPKTSDDLRDAMSLMIRQTIRSKRPGEGRSGWREPPGTARVSLMGPFSRSCTQVRPSCPWPWSEGGRMGGAQLRGQRPLAARCGCPGGRGGTATGATALYPASILHLPAERRCGLHLPLGEQGPWAPGPVTLPCRLSPGPGSPEGGESALSGPQV